MCETYNGWKNYETWAVGLWMTNTEGDYKRLTEIINNHSTIGASAQELREEIIHFTDHACYDDDSTPKIPLMLINILMAGLAHVDYHAIIQGNIELKNTED